jgi:hypothetical protein
MTYTFKAWTGPMTLKEVARLCRVAGVTVAQEGTEHVYLTVEAADEVAAKDALRWQLPASLNWMDLELSNVRS